MNNYTQLDFTKLKPVNYNRKSSESEDKQMLSIVSQEEEAQRIADYYKLPKFIKVFRESKSAKKEFVRTEFMEMIKMIKVGSVDAIVCWKLDRLARNMTEGGMIIDLISSGTIKAILTHDKVYYPTDNVLLMSVEFGQGKQFLKDLSVNVKRGQNKKASMGTPHGVSALGFLNDKTEEKGNRKWLVDETRLAIIKELFNLFLTGTYSAGKLYKHATEVLKLTTVSRKRSGGQLITNSRIYEILKDPIYAGFFFYDGIRYELDKDLPRIITEAQHKKVKLLLTSKNIAKTQEHDTVYSGFIKSDEGDFVGPDVKFQVICDCKNKFAYRNKTNCPKCGIDIDKMENPKYLEYKHYYNVKKKKHGLPYKSLNEKFIDERITDLFINNLSFSKDVVEWSKKYIHEMKEKEISHKILINQRKEERKIELQEKKARTRVMLRDNKITQEEYDLDIETLNSEYLDTKEDFVAVDWYSRLMEIADISSRIETVLNSGDVEAKRKILSALGSNLVWDDEKLLINNTDEVDALINAVKRNKLEYPKFEPKNHVVNKGLNEKNPHKNDGFSTMLLR
jgi:site-specific DNA recombinase